MVQVAYQEVVEQLIKIFEDHLNGPRARARTLALVALCVGGMVLARNVCDPDLADDFRRAAHAEVLRAAGWNSASLQTHAHDGVIGDVIAVSPPPLVASVEKFKQRGRRDDRQRAERTATSRLR